MKLNLQHKSKNFSVDCESEVELSNEIFRLFGIKRIQQRILLAPTTTTTKPKPIVFDELKQGSVLIVKDLGPQISWKLVFILEYLGPILIHLIMFSTSSKSLLHYTSLIMICIHYGKREYETLHVHRFSNATMPILNLPKNCFHYWVIGGLLVAWDVYSRQVDFQFDYSIACLVALWMFCQVSNFKTHLILMNLRPEGTRVRKIPNGYGFDLVTCPNYFFEILGWVCFSLIVGGWMSWLFTAVGAIQMWFWAVKKHERYNREFNNYPKRKILIPFVL